MLRIGITGQSGFIGGHLFNTLNLRKESFTTIDFEDSIFDDKARLEAFVSKCDVIVHLAAINRSVDPEKLYSKNIELVEKLISACETTGSLPHIIFSSSTQESLGNEYGMSKLKGRLLFEEWSKRNGASFTGIIIPNVFGPFCRPFYNSVVATFSYQLTHGENPEIHIDADLNLIYIGELVDSIIRIILDRKVTTVSYNIDPTSKIKVSELLNILNDFENKYLEKGVIPDLGKTLLRNLFITFMTYIDYEDYFPKVLKKNVDARGSFIEILKVENGGQFSFSDTKTGIQRGDHFHVRKIERFSVIKGSALIEIRQIGTENVYSFQVDGNSPSYVDMKVWHTHSIKNTGTDDLYTLFWISEFFDPDDPDTFFEKVRQVKS